MPQFSGFISKIYPAITGTSARGPWVSQSFVLTYDALNPQYPKSICFNVFGENKLNEFRLNLNEQVTCHIDFETTEYNGRCYNKVSCWKVERGTEAQPQGQPQYQAPAQSQYQAPVQPQHAPQAPVGPGCQPYAPAKQEQAQPAAAPQATQQQAPAAGQATADDLPF